MSTVALPNHYLSASSVGTMYSGQQGMAPQAHAYDHAKIYDSTKAYDNITSGTATAAAYNMWPSPFKYDALAANWPATATANSSNAWYGAHPTGLGIGQIVKPEQLDYRYVFLTITLEINLLYSKAQSLCRVFLSKIILKCQAG